MNEIMEGHHVGRLRLRRMRIRGFKAIADLDLTFPDDPHTPLILIGGNGSGKSSILQALAFIQFVTKGQTREYFDARGWKPADVRSRVATRLAEGAISFRLLLEDDRGRKVYWRMLWGLADERMRQEEIWCLNKEEWPGLKLVLRTKGDSLIVKPEEYKGIRPKGSAVSVLDPSAFPEITAEVLRSVKCWGEGVYALDLLSPAKMRSSSRKPDAIDIGNSGEHLAAFLANLKSDGKNRIVKRLAAFYPPLQEVVATRKRAGWIDLKIAESYGGVGQTAAAHMSDGFMRMLGLAAIPEFGERASTILLDEIEDGIEPHILPDFVETIAREADAQLVLTSHSPILVNFASPSAVVFVARSIDGRTVAARFDQLAPLTRHLEHLGPGELWTQASMESINSWVIAANPAENDENRSVVGYSAVAAADFMDGR
ncbi:AAA family ATPase [Skermanella pratensis]|uniref:AAA family ATPase n=1 Tax=Skermanella pratensis TaxID=2233999 RepID=UPI0013012522|nr:ATP-binding protein [Skermanella pratensis]